MKIVSNLRVLRPKKQLTKFQIGFPLRVFTHKTLKLSTHFSWDRDPFTGSLTLTLKGGTEVNPQEDTSRRKNNNHNVYRLFIPDGHLFYRFEMFFSFFPILSLTWI